MNIDTTPRHFAECEQYHDAFDMMKAMLERIPNVNLAYYIDMDQVAKIRSKVGAGADLPPDQAAIVRG